MPGAFPSVNFDVSYDLGNLTILPATLNVKADNISPLCNGIPSLTSTITGYKNGDSAAIVIASGPSMQLLDNANQSVFGVPNGGVYQIIPSGVT